MMPAPQHNSPRSSVEEAIFHAASELDDNAARAEFLARACHGDDALRQRVEALLAAQDRAAQFFADDPLGLVRRPARAIAKGETALADAAKNPTIARYKLLEKLGEGGCGVVYAAEQTEPVVRRVAIKVIKPGMDSRAVIARFEAERQALALMDHPNIARVLDAGETKEGRPYFVMELVRGVRITDYCEQYGLPTRARIELFTQVCHAIQHAHQKGVIHRDIKPSNILVTLHDGVPVPKVIDFGIAKAIEGRLSEETVYTRLHQFIGTPAYMSPEQAELSGLDIDTRSDIYSLGVLLYELLSGSTPFDAKDLAEAGLDAMRRIIREQEPIAPSTRLSGFLRATGETAGSVDLAGEQRRRALEERARFLRGDLDAIVLKCLEKDRRRRYDAANSLADDLRRHLDNEPVSARPASAAYRLRKLLRRHRTSVVVGAAILVVLVAGAAVSTWQAFRATRATRLAVAAQAVEAEQRELAETSRRDAEREAVQARRAAARADARMYFQSRYMPEALQSTETVNKLGAEWEDGYMLHRIVREARGRWNLAARLKPAVQPQAVFLLAASKGMLVVTATGVRLDVHQGLGGAWLFGKSTSEPIRRFLPTSAGAFLALGEKTVVALDRETLDEVASYRGEARILSASSTGTFLLLFCDDGVARLLRHEDLTLVDQLAWGTETACRGLPTPDEVAVSTDGSLALFRGGSLSEPAILWDRRGPVPSVARVTLPAQRLTFIDNTRVAFWRMLGRGDTDDLGFIGVYSVGKEPKLETLSGMYSPDLNGQAELHVLGVGDETLAPVLGLVGPGGVVVLNVSRIRTARTTDRFHNLTPLAAAAPEFLASFIGRGWLVLREGQDLLVFSQSGDGYGDAVTAINRTATATSQGLFFVGWPAGPGIPRLGFEAFDALGGRRGFELEWPNSENLSPWMLAVASDKPVYAVVAGAKSSSAGSSPSGECVARIFRPGPMETVPTRWSPALEFGVGPAPAAAHARRFAALTEDGEVLLVWNGGKEGVRFDTGTGKRLGACELGPVSAVTRDGSTVVTATSAGILRLYDVRSGTVVREWPGAGVGAVCFSTDGAVIAAALGGSVALFDTRTGERRGTIDQAVLPLALSSEAGRLFAFQPAARGSGGTLVLVDTKDGRIAEVVERFGGEFTPAWFSDDGRALAVVEDRNLAAVRRSLSWEEVRTLLTRSIGDGPRRVMPNIAHGQYELEGGRRLVSQLMMTDINARELRRLLTAGQGSEGEAPAPAP